MLKLHCNNNHEYKKHLKKKKKSEKMQLLGCEPTHLGLIGHRGIHYAMDTDANNR